MLSFISKDLPPAHADSSCFCLESRSSPCSTVACTRRQAGLGTELRPQDACLLQKFNWDSVKDRLLSGRTSRHKPKAAKPTAQAAQAGASAEPLCQRRQLLVGPPGPGPRTAKQAEAAEAEASSASPRCAL